MAAWILAISVSMVIIMIHYEVMAFASWLWKHTSPRISNRLTIGFTMILLFFAHLIEIQIFAAAFYVGAEILNLGHLTGVPVVGLGTYSYFSAVTYTSVGYGDLVAVGELRFLAGVEALMGLLMIAWSGAFTVFLMQKSWEAGEG